MCRKKGTARDALEDLHKMKGYDNKNVKDMSEIEPKTCFITVAATVPDFVSQTNVVVHRADAPRCEAKTNGVLPKRK